MPKSSGGGGNGGRSGGGSGDAGQPGEVVRAAEEAKLQARVDNMNQLVGKLNQDIKAKETGIANMEKEISRLMDNNRDRQSRETRRSLERQVSKANRQVTIERKRMLNIYDRMNKIIDENS